MFSYSSVQSHRVITPEGEKIKETHVNVNNGKGTKTVILKDNKKIHKDTIALKKSEIKNIQKHKFMPNFFKKSLKNIKTMRKKLKQRSVTKKKG